MPARYYLKILLFAVLYAQGGSVVDIYSFCRPENGSLPFFPYSVGDYDFDFAALNSTEQGKKCGAMCVSAGPPNRKILYSIAAVMKCGLCFCAHNDSNANFVIQDKCDTSICSLNNTNDSSISPLYVNTVETKRIIGDFLINIDKNVKLLTTEQLTVNFTSGTDIEVAVDFGDGTGKSNFKRSSEWRHIFMSPAYYTITVYAKNVYTDEKSTQVNILATGMVKGVDFDCPPAFEKDKECACTVRTRMGSGLTLSISSFFDNSPLTQPEELKLDDPIIVPVGRSALDIMSAMYRVSASRQGIFIMPNYRFPSKGSITAFEFYVAKEGTFRFQVFRPICPPDIIYCKLKGNCGSCHNPDLTCSGSNVFCTQNAAFPTVPTDGFLFVSEIIFQTSSTGYKLLNVNTSTMGVEEGDMLGITLNGGYLGNEQKQEVVFTLSPQSLVPGERLSKSSISAVNLTFDIRALESRLAKAPFSYQSNKIGTIKIVASVNNSLSGEVAVKEILVQERIRDLFISVPQDYRINGYELGKPLQMKAEIRTGSHEQYEWFINNATMNFTYNSTIPTQIFTPTNPGVYYLLLNTSNLISTDNRTVVFGVLARIENLEVMAYEETIFPPNVNKSFGIRVTGGTNVTLAVDVGDSRPPKEIFIANARIPVTVNLSLSYVECGSLTVNAKATNFVGTNLTKSLPVKVVCPLNGVTIVTNPPAASDNTVQHALNSKFTVIIAVKEGSYLLYNIDFGDGTLPEIKNHSQKIEPETVTVYHDYKTNKTFTLNITISNDLASLNFSFVVVVTLCSAPLIELAGSPYEESPIYITRGVEFKFKGIPLYRNLEACKKDEIDARVTYDKWILSKKTGDVYQQIKTMAVVKNDLTFVIKPLSLEEGRYKIDLVQLYADNASPVVSNYTSYIFMKKSPLFATILDGNSRTVPLMKILPSGNRTFWNFTVESSVYDPDIVPKISNDPNITYRWECSRITNGSIVTAALNARKKSNSSVYSGEVCFSLSPTLLTSAYLKNGKARDLNFNTAMFLENVTYKFVLSVFKDTRTINVTQFISMLPGSPPSINFRCRANCKSKVNFQERIIIEGKCGDCPPSERVLYSWQLLYKNGTKHERYISNDITFSATGWNRENLVINSYQLTQGTAYRIKLAANFEGSAVTSVIEQEYITTTAPTKGICLSSDTKGIVGQTKFIVTCQKWKSEDSGITYQFRYRIKDEQMPSQGSASLQNDPIWYYGRAPQNRPSVLPLGNKDNNYTVVIRVRVLNDYDSYTEADPLKIEVRPMPQSNTGNLASAINSSRPSLDNPQAVAQWATAYSSILNSESSKADTTPASTTAEATTAEEQKNERLQIRKELLSTIKDLTSSFTGDIQSVQQIGSTISSITNAPDEIDAESQEQAAFSVAVLASSLLSTAEAGAGPDQVVKSTETLIQACSNLLKAADNAYQSLYSQAEGLKSEENEQESSSSVLTTVSTKPTKAKELNDKAKERKGSVLATIKAIDHLQKAVLNGTVSGEKAREITTEQLTLSVQKWNKNDGSNAPLTSFVENAEKGSFNGFQLPNTTLNQTQIGDADVEVKMISFNSNPFGWDVSAAKDSVSRINTLNLAIKGYDLEVKDLSDPIIITNENNASLLTGRNIGLDYPRNQKVVKEELNSIDDPLIISFQVKDNYDANLTILIQYGIAPTESNYDIALNLSSRGLSIGNTSVALNHTSMNISGMNQTKDIVRQSNIYAINSNTIIMWDFANFTYGFLRSKEVFFAVSYSGDVPPPIEINNIYTFDKLRVQRKVNVSMKTFSPRCCFWNESSDHWSKNGCELDVYNTTFNVTTCKCYHLTSFGGFFVAPNPIPALSADMFLKGYVLFVAVVSVLLLYIIGLIIARRADKRDLSKVGVSPLPDNNPNDRYLYELTVWTGMRRSAGTTSNVYFILSGDEGDTRIRHLKDPERQTFQRASSDVFIFSTPKPLGDLSHIRIWHDNSGGGWYCRNIVVTDLQTEKPYQFLANRWLAVDEGDGMVECVLPASGKDELSDFNYIFTTKTRRDLSDSHLWFSIYARPPRSTFTRVQRLSCCVSLLMTSMMANAMFYGAVKEPTAETANNIGNFQFTWQQVYVAIICTCITLPVNVIIVTIFRGVRPKLGKSTGERISSASRPASGIINNEKNMPSPATSSEGINEGINLIREKQEPMPPSHSVLIDDGEEKAIELDNKDIDKKDGKKKKSKGEHFLPYWCIYIAWVLVFISVIVSSVMIIIYGMVFGNLKSIEWLSSVTLSFVQDVLVIQPFKVFIIAVFVALIIKKIDDNDRSEVEQEGKKLAEDEEWLHAYAGGGLLDAVDTESLRPPDKLQLDDMRQLRFKERKMHAITREIIFYCFFFTIVLSIAYNAREQIAFYQSKGVSEIFTAKLREGRSYENQKTFGAVFSYNDFWDWADEVLLPVLYPSPWYADVEGATEKTKEFPGKLFIGDGFSKLVNGARMRQLRTKPDTCTIAKETRPFIPISCIDSYGLLDEEKDHYLYNWSTKAESKQPINPTTSPWKYQDWLDLDGYPFMAKLATYFGGGYAVEMFPRWDNKKTFKYLKDNRWLDRHSRALFIEFAIFNGFTNHFTAASLVFEFPPTGGCLQYSSIMTFKLFRYTTGYAFFVIACEILFFLCILIFLFREAKEIYREGTTYVKSFWNIVEANIVVLSLIAIGFYFYKDKLAKDLVSKLPSKKPNIYINFQFASYWDQLYTYLLALVVFFVTVKFIRLFRFNKRMGVLASTLKASWGPLALFSVVIGISLTASCLFAVLVFGIHLEGYRNFMVGAATQVSLLLGKFSYYEFEKAHRLLGPIYFFCYIIMVNFILLNMFISIINDSFEEVQGDVHKQSNEYEIIDFLMDNLKNFVGFGKTKKEEITEDIKWEKAMAKIKAVNAFEEGTPEKQPKKVQWDDAEVVGLADSIAWKETPFLNDSLMEKEMDMIEINNTVNKFIKCINLLYFDDPFTAKKMAKEARKELDDLDTIDL